MASILELTETAAACEQQRGKRPRDEGDDQARRDEQGDGPGQQRGGNLGGFGVGPRTGPVSPWAGGVGPTFHHRLVRRAVGGRPGQDGHDHAGERATDDDVVDDVGHLVGGRVCRAQAVAADRVREDKLAAEAHHPRDHGDAADQCRSAPDATARLAQRAGLGDRGRRAGHGDVAAAEAPASRGSAGGGLSRPGTGAAGTGRRPSMSSHRKAGVRSMTAVKLTTSLAAVSPVIAASRTSRAGRDRLVAAATPSSAPSALAPASPSIARSPRSSGSRAAAAPSGAATADSAPTGDRPPRAPPASSVPLARATFRARPGRRSNRFSRLAPPAASPALIATSAGPPPSSRADPRPVAPMPPSLTAPVVTSPWARAPRCPRNPRRLPLPARSSYPPNAAAPVPANASAALTRGARPGAIAEPTTLAPVSAGPSRRVTGSPRWLVLVQRVSPPGGRRDKTA